MHFTIISSALYVFLTLFPSISALPDVFERAMCNRDNCLRAVAASSQAPYPSSARRDCSSFMTATVTPCPAIKQTTITTTTTGATTTKTASVTVIDTETDTYTVISTTQVTVLGQRGITSLPCPATASATKVPAYASACSGAARYSSACSCMGITKSVLTLSQPTVLSTIVSTRSATTTATITQTSTSDIESTTTVTSIATQSVSPCYSDRLAFQAIGGIFDGQFLSLNLDTAFPDFSSGVTDANLADTFKMDVDSQTILSMYNSDASRNNKRLVGYQNGYLLSASASKSLANCGNGGICPFRCSYDDTLNNQPMDCNIGFANHLSTCPTAPHSSAVAVSQTVDVDCVEFQLRAVNVCS